MAFALSDRVCMHKCSCILHGCPLVKRGCCDVLHTMPNTTDVQFPVPFRSQRCGLGDTDMYGEVDHWAEATWSILRGLQ